MARRTVQTKLFTLLMKPMCLRSQDKTLLHIQCCAIRHILFVKLGTNFLLNCIQNEENSITIEFIQ